MLKSARVFLTAGALAFCGCSGGTSEPPAALADADAVTPIASYHSLGDVSLVDPVGVALDFTGNAFVSDGSVGRIILVTKDGSGAQEFQQPTRSPGFYPADVCVYGFYVYSVDQTGRTILRFSTNGAYRDVLLNFEQLTYSRRVSPFGIATDGSGRIAITDVENHQILLFDSYLSLEAAFGNYGSHMGQLDTPKGVSFTPKGSVVVADTGNRRIQIFSTTGSVERVLPADDKENYLQEPRRAVMDQAGHIYVADPRAGRVFIFGPDGRLLQSLVPPGVSPFRPTDVELSTDGRIYVTDAASSTLFVFQVL